MLRSITCLAAVAATVSATAVDLTKRASPLAVSLTSVSDTKVKIAVTNTGSEDYNLFYKGTFLDSDSPADKLVVSSAAAVAPFNGVFQRMATHELSADVFKPLLAGQTLEEEVEIAELYELGADGEYSVAAIGAMPYAPLNSTSLSGKALPFSSNKLAINVEAAKAAAVPFVVDKMIAKRTTIQSDCTGSRLTAVRTGLSNCARLATAAATAASSGNAAKFSEYFKTTSSTTRNTVAARLRAVATDCSTSSTRTKTYCTDVYGGCSSNVLAYTVPSLNIIAYCPIFFSYLPALSGQCHAQDQATTILHEETHAPAVYSPGTNDNGYGYAAATSLSTSGAVNNADSYALYANGQPTQVSND
ncbi:hypothetical protein B0A48_02873 [Cryoendolithus antarcticus]|uniref:Neutral protease 2 n=1 Tax=Cryoendolithus antarcticus TaxID=1507870 RepID=A0A1V8TLZ1_9PEZI|nr:hypothetical protein B0A48_02873 [Cryoendolithus antarcticus]